MKSRVVFFAISAILSGQVAFSQLMWQKSREESLKHYNVQTLSFPLSHFGEEFYDEMIKFIGTFKPEKKPSMLDGNTSTFRCVVAGSQVWTLVNHEPQQRRARAISKLCIQIIEDAEAGKFDESKYIGLLKAM